MSVIKINLDLVDYVYPDTKITDVWEMIYDALHTELDTRMIYTQDIIDTWDDMGHPEPEEGHGSITDQIHQAVYETFMQEDHTEEWCDARDEYAAKLLDRMDCISLLDWDNAWTIEETREQLDNISDMEMDDAHKFLLEIRDQINVLS